MSAPHLEALGELALGLIAADRRRNDDVLAWLPVHRSGNRVVRGQLKAVDHTEELHGGT